MYQEKFMKAAFRACSKAAIINDFLYIYFNNIVNPKDGAQSRT